MASGRNGMVKEEAKGWWFSWLPKLAWPFASSSLRSSAPQSEGPGEDAPLSADSTPPSESPVTPSADIAINNATGRLTSAMQAVEVELKKWQQIRSVIISEQSENTRTDNLAPVEEEPSHPQTFTLTFVFARLGDAVKSALNTVKTMIEPAESQLQTELRVAVGHIDTLSKHQTEIHEKLTTLLKNNDHHAEQFKQAEIKLLLDDCDTNIAILNETILFLTSVLSEIEHWLKLGELQDKIANAFATAVIEMLFGIPALNLELGWANLYKKNFLKRINKEEQLIEAVALGSTARTQVALSEANNVLAEMNAEVLMMMEAQVLTLPVNADAQVGNAKEVTDQSLKREVTSEKLIAPGALGLLNRAQPALSEEVERPSDTVQLECKSFASP